MTPDELLRLDRLRLLNFRCFASCEIKLHPQLTVLVAENGQGKTTILDAAAIAMQLFVDTVADTHQFRGFDHSDVRLSNRVDETMTPMLPTVFEADGVVFGKKLHWSRALKSYGLRVRTTLKDAESLRGTASALREMVEGTLTSRKETETLLPLLALYDTGRLWSERSKSARKKSAFTASDDRFSGYRDCFSTSSSFKGIADWYEKRMGEIGNPSFSTELGKSLPLVNAVRAAIQTVLDPTGWCDLNWNARESCLVVAHATHGVLPLSDLSDGIRNMIALVADIARRCAILNPHLREKAAEQTPGILLIDEVDMHLHPRWQQLIVGLLQKAFPTMQMILTTHSPHVLSAVDFDSIRVVHVEDGTAVVGLPSFQTRGVESADILAKVMHVDPVPQVEQASWLSDYRAIVQTGTQNSKPAQELWDRLVEHFGIDHPVLVEVEILRRLQEFRHINNIPPSTGI